MNEIAQNITAPEGSVGDTMSSKAISDATNLSINAASPKIKKLRKHCRKSAQLLEQEQYAEAAKEALAALDINEKDSLANHVAAIAMDRLDRFDVALQLYNRAIQAEPQNAEIYRNVGLMAWRMGKLDVAEQFFRLEGQIAPDSWQPKNNLGNVLRDKSQLDDSIELLRAALYQHPEVPELWTAIGSTAIYQLQTDEAIQFHSEAVRLDPNNAKAHHNLGFTHLTDKDPAQAIIHFEDALKLHKPNTFDAVASLNARSNALLSVGRLEEGWKEYEIRHNHFAPDFTQFLMPMPLWESQDIKGKKLILVGEQGLGDEVLFSSVLNDMLKMIGPEGQLGVAVERRLVPLFKRSFPQIEVFSHRTGKSDGIQRRVVVENEEIKKYDLWAPLGAPLKHLRNDISDFKQPNDGFLVPDPDRVAHWKGELEKLPAGRKSGILWKSGVMDVKRGRSFAAFEAWKPILTTPDITWINLQYGDADADIKLAKDKFRIDIHTLSGIDLKQDLDDITALSKALDLVVGPMNATTNLAGAVGTPFWLLWPKTVWTQLGTGQMPWYPNTRTYSPDQLKNWAPAIARLASDLAQEANS
ncbi:tetratricopeptide repeat protein [Hirschia litorea]|uniref:Tetratricopeptide repeat protein n=1 Tax=Hirschia litorea TaxID=1199156 RepID=A0ABW2IL13_9PROT